MLTFDVIFKSSVGQRLHELLQVALHLLVLPLLLLLLVRLPEFLLVALAQLQARVEARVYPSLNILLNLVPEQHAPSPCHCLQTLYFRRVLGFRPDLLPHTFKPCLQLLHILAHQLIEIAVVLKQDVEGVEQVVVLLGLELGLDALVDILGEAVAFCELEGCLNSEVGEFFLAGVGIGFVGDLVEIERELEEGVFELNFGELGGVVATIHLPITQQQERPAAQSNFPHSPHSLPIFPISLFKQPAVMRRDKPNLNVSTSHINRLKRYHDYFAHEKTFTMTPNSRSLPKKKPQPKHSSKKPLKNRRDSINIKKSKKNEGSPFNRHKVSRHDHSINRQYDSPSKENDDLDFILADRPKPKKASGLAEATIDRVYEKLTNNELNKSIEILEQALRVEQNNYDMNYLLGVCYLIKGAFDQAINIFDTLLERKARKNIYLLLSVCYKKMEDYEETQKILNECLKKNPKSYEAYIYRGKLYLRLKKYREALADFDKAIRLNPDKQIGYVGKGDCLRLCERYDEAKAIYAKALHMSKKTNASILLRRAICSMELKRYEPAFDDIEQLLAADPENSEALYFKGLIFNKQKLQNEAIICYEQAIKFNSNKKAVTRSIYELTKIKIEHRDYYEALYTLERGKFLDIDEKVIRKFKIFADGVTEMMKKNFQEGIKILSELIDDFERPVGSFLKPLIYSSRSYGYMSLSKFQQARDDLQKLEAEFSLDIPNLYNKFICEGILACNSQKYEQALSFFSKASKIMPSRIEPFYYKAVTLICFVAKLIPKDMKAKQEEYLQSALKTIMKCEKEIENNPSLFLVKGFIHYALGDGEKGLADLDKYMNEAMKQSPLNLYLNGMILAEHFGRYEEAIEEFKKAISAEEDHKIPEIYLNRAKCQLLNGDINGGFVDLQTYMSFRPSSPEIHIWAGHLLFYIGAEDAVKAYSNINNINKNTEVLLYRAKCYLHFKDVVNTLANLKLILDAKYDNRVFFDYHILDALRECSEEETADYPAILNKIKETKQHAHSTGETKFGHLFKESDYQFYKGVLYFYCKEYEKSAKNFERALKLVEDQIAGDAEHGPEILQFYKLSYSNIPFNYFECLYNIALCELMSGNVLKGKKKLKIACDKCPPEGDTKNQLLLFIHHLDKEIHSQFDRKGEAAGEDQAELSPFPSDNRLCSIFPEFIIPLSTPIQTRLFFCLPSVEKPDIRPKFDEKLFDEISMATIEIKPEAPWIRRSEQGVIFTDDVVGVDVELSQTTSEEEQESGREQQEEDFDSGEDDDNDGNHSDQLGRDREDPSAMNPSELKDFFRLDPAVEARLARLRDVQ